MMNRTRMREKLGRVFVNQQAEVLSEVIYDAYHDLVRADDFNELKGIVKELAEAQQHLAKAQQRTEQRVEDLAETQQHLAEAQQRTEQRVEELAEAQQHTEHALQQLTRQMGGLARQMGGMSDRMGGDLEEVAAIMIHDVLEREFGWQIDELDRAWQMWNGEEEEIDVFGQAHDPLRPDTTLWIVGEVKFNLTMRDVERFTFLLARAARHLEGEIVPVCFSYRVRPSVREATKMTGYHLVLSNGRLVAGGGH